MGDQGLSINISADVLEYVEQKFLKQFGKDNDSVRLASWFKGLQQTALKQTSEVHCVGMKSPLAFDKIYQPTRLLVGPEPGEVPSESYSWGDRVSRSILRGRAFNEKSITVDELLQRDHDALIFGGPGWGKTTFLHYIYRATVKHDFLLPVLISLRRPNAVDDLEKYVIACSQIQKKQHKACTLLLVDGYDELNIEQRKRVSETLLQFQAISAGKFYLTCREYYRVSQLTAPEVRLEAFTREDQVRFVHVFLSTFSLYRRENAEVVVKQLEERGFTEFLSHPLLLTLACIVRTTSTSFQPRSALRLLEYALDVLRFDWDEQKNIDRQRTTPLDGQQRMRILKQIAYIAKSPFVKRPRAEEIARKQLTLLGWDKVEPRDALMEIARFYGILVPAEDGYEFVHRTIHDFLAAKQWVESGKFEQQSTYQWNARTGYAACLVENATEVLKKALAAPDGLPAVTEIIGNDATFENQPIADAMIAYFSENGRVLQHERRSQFEAGSESSPRIVGQLESDFLRLANSRFLDFVVEYCCEKNSPVADLLVAYAATELYDRRVKLTHQTYNKALAAYKTERFAFVVLDAKQVQLHFLNPVLQNRLKDYKQPVETED
jgi:hypothetical protein